MKRKPRDIAIMLLRMLAGTFAIFTIMIVLTFKNRLDALPHFERLFEVWLPVLAGLVSSAVTFFTKERKWAVHRESH